MNLREFAQNVAKSKVAQMPSNRHLFDKSKGYETVGGDFVPFHQAQLSPKPFPLTREEPHQIGSEEKLNQTERDYLAWLRTLGDARIWVQAFTLKLGPKCHYFPDFAALDAQGLRFIDTKASWNKGKTPHIEDDAVVKLKWAAQLYAPMRFLVAWKGKDGTWRHKCFEP